MEILNIGPLELIIILLIAFVLLGPRDMILTAQRVGRFIRNLVRSPMWKEVLGYSMEIRELPQKIMDETGLQETLAEVTKSTKEVADELNAQVKEATEAARVPEVEHLRINPNAVVSGPPTAPAVSAPVPQKESAGETAAEQTPPVVTPDMPVAPDAAQPAVLDVATPGETAAPVDTAKTGDVSTSADMLPPSNDLAAAGITGPVAPKKTRKRKTAAADEQTAVTETPPVPPLNGSAQERATLEATLPSSEETPAAEAAQPARRVRRPRVAKKAAVVEVASGALVGSGNGNGAAQKESPEQQTLLDPEEQPLNSDAA
jgi:sec-independent protein translocase protein TatB